ncbi:Methyl esterase 10, putative isoform 2 [Hibiscus syriacus]|uniref:Methyl esterase 10, putative isoform 2 n=1 Tax=Hibiscus syriacus TaxID=106335 RepID=A0A6A3AXR7_HIBSY|nr:Methyl esterase 10, putative isoform 2 [Hibiscus syriacus]
MGLGQAKHFVLVHGSCHGAWSWYKVVPLLKSGGHKVTAIDLAGSGVDPQQVNTLRSISDYIKPLREFMASLPDKQKVVLVAHSLGGLAISQAMQMFPEKISVAVFVTATMPGPTLNVSILIQKALNDQDSQMDNHYTYDGGLPTTFTFGPMFLCSKVYQLSPPEARFCTVDDPGKPAPSSTSYQRIRSYGHDVQAYTTL